MTTLTTASDLDQIFADRGSPATLLTVRAVYAPESQTISEVIQETDITVIPGTIEQQSADGTAGAHRVQRCQFLVRTSELTALAQGELRRLSHAGIVYEYLSVAESPHSGLTALTVRR